MVHQRSSTIDEINPLSTLDCRDSNECDAENCSSEREVFLRRGPLGFGFNLVAGESNSSTSPGIHPSLSLRLGKVFISFVAANGPAYESGQLRKGDQILSVNGIDLRGSNHEEAAATLKSCGKEATLRVIHRYDGTASSRRSRSFRTSPCFARVPSIATSA